MAVKFNIKQNDTAPTLRVFLRDARNRAVGLTGASIVFHMRLTADLSSKISSGTVTIHSATLGDVSYSFSATDTNTAGVYQAEFQVTFADGTIQTFPNDDYIVVTVTDDVA